jgi:3-oxoacyl-[acyl-carrier-protein] synthase III
VAPLNACYLACELARAGRLQQAMVVASEVENNRQEAPDDLLGLREMGSAFILHEAEDGETGFQAFGFYYFHEYHDTVKVTGTWNDRGRPYLIAEISPEWQNVYLDCLDRGVSQFLEEQELVRDEVALLLPPQISPSFVEQAASRLGFERERTVNAAIQGQDMFTSSLPVAMQAVRDRHLASPGDLGLIVCVGDGVQVGCALYRF